MHFHLCSFIILLDIVAQIDVWGKDMTLTGSHTEEHTHLKGTIKLKRMNRELLMPGRPCGGTARLEETDRI